MPRHAIIMFISLWLCTSVARATVPEEEHLFTIPEGHKQVNQVVFSPDGKRFAYAARAAGGSLIVVDGQAGTPSTFADSPMFSADGKHVVYRAGKRVRKAERWWIVLDGKKLKTYDWVGEPAISATGKVAYWMGTGVRLGGPMGAYSGGRSEMAYRHRIRCRVGTRRQPRDQTPTTGTTDIALKDVSHSWPQTGTSGVRCRHQQGVATEQQRISEVGFRGRGDLRHRTPAAGVTRRPLENKDDGLHRQNHRRHAAADDDRRIAQTLGRNRVAEMGQDLLLQLGRRLSPGGRYRDQHHRDEHRRSQQRGGHEDPAAGT